MKITSKGQVTIPQTVRERLGFLPHTEVEWEIDGNTARLRKVTSTRRGEALIQRLRGSAGPGMTTDEIMALTRGED
ncbi:MAG: AbrB/MazE/SpoVT family DNA-binding domain-containing protein [Gemmatimonadota bacterium]|nr:AbrB/MazE/SpoVT family DNA-binding domain-containing protein [Gemmatimonadota bacterium]